MGACVCIESNFEWQRRGRLDFRAPKNHFSRTMVTLRRAFNVRPPSISKRHFTTQRATRKTHRDRQQSARSILIINYSKAGQIITRFRRCCCCCVPFGLSCVFSSFRSARGAFFRSPTMTSAVGERCKFVGAVRRRALHFWAFEWERNEWWCSLWYCVDRLNQL